MIGRIYELKQDDVSEEQLPVRADPVQQAFPVELVSVFEP